MSTRREKEIKYLMYLKEKLIRETKKEVKQLRLEYKQINNKKKKEKWLWIILIKKVGGKLKTIEK